MPCGYVTFLLLVQKKSNQKKRPRLHLRSYFEGCRAKQKELASSRLRQLFAFNALVPLSASLSCGEAGGVRIVSYELQVGAEYFPPSSRQSVPNATLNFKLSILNFHLTSYESMGFTLRQISSAVSSSPNAALSIIRW